ncbi:hypothetical protein CFK37_11290 [Virgibacillus phasianinus]|uniref:Uncharacterized protein n=1 Tax=Virgibacillus phasianinus TaxID=2017483 RepID=A0A220U3P6_9BACI|nr:hypothetical protein [Virgibacillus phasianinus]ASK62685.1 hypothetical protein CFK37_11290 [Virgibacillus phasianinus]
MKSEEKVVTFTEEQIVLYQRMLGETDKRDKLILHYTMPMIAYQWVNIPWTFKPPIIHRKQQCVMHTPMVANEKYRASVTLDKRYTRKDVTFSKQTLRICTLRGTPCFTGTMELVSGGQP